MSVFLTVQEVVAGHHFLMKHIGDRKTAGVRDIDVLAAAVDRPRQTVAGVAVYPTPVEQAAALFEALLVGRCFLEGNARTAMLCLKVFLRVNGIRFELLPNEIEGFVRDVEMGKVPFYQLVERIEKNCVRLGGAER